MRKRNREINIFNLSMLDVMTGALGAVMMVMIVLLSQKMAFETEEVNQELKKGISKLNDTLNTAKDLDKKTVNTEIGKEVSENLKKIVDKVSETMQKVIPAKEIKKEETEKESQTDSKDNKSIGFEIPKRLVLLIDISGSMQEADKEDRLAQMKAALKVFIAGMSNEYEIDVVFYPAFKENIDEASGLKLIPEIEQECQKDFPDNAYKAFLVSDKCYKYGSFFGKLEPVATVADKQKFFKLINGLKAYQGTPTSYALEYILTEPAYNSAEGILIFSDGTPDSLVQMGGEIGKIQKTRKFNSPKGFIEYVKNLNRAAGNKKIFTIGIGEEFRTEDKKDQGVSILKQLAEQNSGFYLSF
jgi:endonuclease IV